MTTPTFPSVEALRRLRLLSAHQYRRSEFALAYGGEDPDDDRLCAEASPRGFCRGPWGDSPVSDWSLGLQGSSDLDVELPDMTLDEVEAILNVFRPHFDAFLELDVLRAARQ